MKIGIGIIDGDEVRMRVVTTLRSHDSLFPGGYDYGFRLVDNTVYWWELPELITDFMRACVDNYLDRHNYPRQRRHISMLSGVNFKTVHGARGKHFGRYGN